MLALAACLAMHELTPGLAQQAAREGAALADDHKSYSVAPWVTFQMKDPLRAIHNRAGVDAVIVETPYERVRYYAYLHRLQGDKISVALVDRLYDDARAQLGFVVYAHSKTDEDRTFLSHFTSAQLTGDSGVNETSNERAIFGPSDDFYDVGTFREERWVGSLTYRFPLPRCAARYTVTFADPYGDRYAIPFDLRRYR